MNKNQYQKNKENGRCVVCGKPARENKVHCEECRQKKAIYQRETRAFRVKMGLCPRCGKNKLFGDERTCPECLAQDMIYKKKSRENTGKTDMDYYKELQKQYAENNLCRTGCGRERFGGTTYCETCLIKHRERNKKYRMKKNGMERSERPSYGLCYTCGNSLDGNKRLCNKCSEKVKKNLPKKSGNEYWRKDNRMIFKNI